MRAEAQRWRDLLADRDALASERDLLRVCRNRLKDEIHTNPKP